MDEYPNAIKFGEDNYIEVHYQSASTILWNVNGYEYGQNLTKGFPPAIRYEVKWIILLVKFFLFSL